MLKRVTFQGVFEPTAGGGFSVYFPDLPGCASYGDTLDEAQRNAKDALALHLYGMEMDGDSIPAPSAAPEVDPETAPGYLVCPVTVCPNLVKDGLDNFTENIVRAWDSDFTKVTPEEAKRIEAAEQSGFIAEDDIDWNNLGAVSQE